MLYHVLLPFKSDLSFLRLFGYISFRSAYAALTALVLVLIFGRFIIAWLQRLKLGEQIRTLGPESHKTKAGTPTMGGIIILGAIVVSVALWGNFTNYYLWILLVASIVLGALGLDISKSTYQLGERLEFDPATEKFVGHDEANKLLTRQYREPFVVPDLSVLKT